MSQHFLSVQVRVRPSSCKISIIYALWAETQSNHKRKIHGDFVFYYLDHFQHPFYSEDRQLNRQETRAKPLFVGILGNVAGLG